MNLLVKMHIYILNNYVYMSDTLFNTTKYKKIYKKPF
jgi:hypothetical protein